jgi:hypothetical protein
MQCQIPSSLGAIATRIFSTRRYFAQFVLQPRIKIEKVAESETAASGNAYSSDSILQISALKHVLGHLSALNTRPGGALLRDEDAVV